MIRRTPRPTLFRYTALFRSRVGYVMGSGDEIPEALRQVGYDVALLSDEDLDAADFVREECHVVADLRSEEHKSELQSRSDLVCRLLLEKKKILDRDKTPLPS